MRRHVFLAFMAISLSACAIGAPDPAAIEIHDAQRSPIKWEWRATWQGQSFACSSDDQLRLPLCASAS